MNTKKTLSPILALAAILAVSVCSFDARAQSTTSGPAQIKSGTSDKYLTQSLTTVPTVACVDNSLVMSSHSWSTADITITGTFAGTVVFKQLNDQLAAPTTNPLDAFPVAGGPAVWSFTSNGNQASSAAFVAATPGVSKICVYLQTVSSGTAVVAVNLSQRGLPAITGSGPRAQQAQGGPLGFPVPGSIFGWNGSGGSVLIGPGPSLTPYGQAPRVSVANDVDVQQHFRCAATFTPTATGAVALVDLTGSATKTVHVTKIIISGHATAETETWIGIQRVSALGAGGTTVAPTLATLDGRSGAGNATAVCNHWTTTLKATGTAVGGLINDMEYTSNTITTSTIFTPATILWPEGGIPGPNIVLRGTSDILEIQNLNGGNLGAGTVLDYVIDWFEDSN